MRPLLFFTIIMLGAVRGLTAQDTQFNLSVAADTILMDNLFEVKFELKGADASQFSPPDFEGFEVVSGPNQMMMTSMVNGAVSQQLSYQYYLRPLNEGPQFIGPASIQSGDDLLETEPHQVWIAPNPEGIQKNYQLGSQTRSFEFFHDFGQRPVPAPRAEDVPGEKKKPKKNRRVYRM